MLVNSDDVTLKVGLPLSLNINLRVTLSTLSIVSRVFRKSVVGETLPLPVFSLADDGVKRMRSNY